MCSLKISCSQADADFLQACVSLWLWVHYKRVLHTWTEGKTRACGPFSSSRHLEISQIQALPLPPLPILLSDLITDACHLEYQTIVTGRWTRVLTPICSRCMWLITHPLLKRQVFQLIQWKFEEPRLEVRDSHSNHIVSAATSSCCAVLWNQYLHLHTNSICQDPSNARGSRVLKVHDQQFTSLNNIPTKLELLHRFLMIQ